MFSAWKKKDLDKDREIRQSTKLVLEQYEDSDAAKSGKQLFYLTIRGCWSEIFPRSPLLWLFYKIFLQSFYMIWLLQKYAAWFYSISK